MASCLPSQSQQNPWPNGESDARFDTGRASIKSVRPVNPAIDSLGAEPISLCTQKPGCGEPPGKKKSLGKGQLNMQHSFAECRTVVQRMLSWIALLT